MTKPRVPEAATQTITIEETRQPPESENAAFERRFTNPSMNVFLGWNPTPNTIRSYQFSGAVLDGEFRGVLNSVGFIKGTGYLLPDDFLATLQIDENRLIDLYNTTNVVVGCNLAHGNYFHWVTQSLPAIDIAWHRKGQARRFSVALPPLNHWQKESINLLGFDGLSLIVIKDKEKQYAFKNIEFCEVLNNGAAFCLSEATRQTYSRLRMAVGPATATSLKLYVARSDASSRIMRNENELIAELEKKGFQIVIPGSLTFSEQVRLFKGAELVIGPHGAGMTNIVFCEPGTVVYEIVPAHYTNVCFGNLALICNLRYWADGFESTGDGLPNLRAWQSDTIAVIRRLDEIESIMSDLRDQTQRKPISAMDFLSGKPGQFVTHSAVQLGLAKPVGSLFSRIYPVRSRIRRFLGGMIRKSSDTPSQ